MKNYTISYKQSNDGSRWISCTVTVQAETDYGAIAQVQSRAPYVREIRIISIR